MAHSITLSALFSEFDQWSPVQDTTKRKCKFAFKKLIECFGDIFADELTGKKASRFQIYLKNMHDASIQSYCAAVSQVFAWAVKQKDLTENPFAGLKVRVNIFEVHIYQPDEVEDLLEAANKIRWQDPTAALRWRGFFLCGLHGLREGEIWNLRWDDINLDDGILQIKYRPDKKNEYWQWNAKNKSDREVPMSQSLWECLARLCIIATWRYPFLKQCTCLRLQSQVGNLSEFKRKAPYNNFHREFKRIKLSVNIKRVLAGRKKIKTGDFHQFRKTAGTQLAQQGVPLHDAKDLLGHASIKTTHTYYIATDKQRCLSQGRAAFNAYDWAR